MMTLIRRLAVHNAVPKLLAWMAASPNSRKTWKRTAAGIEIGGLHHLGREYFLKKTPCSRSSFGDFAFPRKTTILLANLGIGASRPPHRPNENPRLCPVNKKMRRALD